MPEANPQAGEASLRFRAPAESLRLRDLLVRALDGEGLGADDDQIAAALDRRDVSVDGVVATDGRRRLAPGQSVEVRRIALPTGSPLPVEGGFRALVASAPWARGGFPVPGESSTSATLRYERVAAAGEVMEIEIKGAAVSADAARVALADAGMPAVADARFGGVLVDGAVRLVPCDADVPEVWWPTSALYAGSDGELPVWRVSVETRRAVERGHPWLLPDAGSEPLDGFAPGALVAVADARGVFGLARVDGGRVAARMWALGATRARDAESPEARVAAALARRRELLDATGEEAVDVVRLVHGEADGLPGLAIDRVGPLLRVLTTARACEPVHERIVDAVCRGMQGWLGSDPPVIEVIHLRGAPPGRRECVRLARGSVDGLLDGDSRLVVKERGLAFRVDPGLTRPEQSAPGFGLFADQRDNRRRVEAFAAGGRWLNLFAHTGAFSAALLRAGAREVVSVDLSGAYLRWLEDNLELNGFGDPGHISVKQDGRRFLETLPPDERFDGIVLDPPTAAAAGRRFWSVSRDLSPLVALAAGRLSRQGVLLVSHNRRRRGPPLSTLVETAFESWRRVRAAPPSPDFPSLRGFPEGDAFEAVLAQRD